MSKLKLMTIVGTRPEIIRLSQIIKACDRSFEHILVHTGQNWDYTLNELFFEDLDIRPPDCYLNCVGETVGHTIGAIIQKAYVCMEEMHPDALLLLGDTNSALSAIAAKRLKIPIFHMEAGNRCFDQNVPEEINRKIVDHIADVNLAYTEHSRRYLRSEGMLDAYTFVIGSPMREVLSANLHKIRQSSILDTLALEPRKYFLVSAHREENIDNEQHFSSLMTAINQIAHSYGMPILYSVHPRSRKFIDKRKFSFHPLVRLSQPLGFTDYNKLQQNAFCVLSDSGTLSEESAMLGFCAVLLRTSTERPEVLDAGSLVIGGVQSNDILQAISLATDLFEEDAPCARVPDYQDENVSIKVVRLIESYTKLINEHIWRK